jgi:cytoskeletal protein CcmA (bactofilin family)
MFRRDKGGSANIDTLISAPTRIQGDVQFSGGLHLDGAVTGSVKALPNQPSRLVISETGVVDGSVEAQVVEMNGRVRGDIQASGRLTLGPKAQVEGNLTYGAIEMAAGARIQGKMKNTIDGKDP